MSLKHELTAITNELPRLQRSNPDGSPAFKWKRVLGKELIDQGITTDREGHPIIANKYYWRNEPMLIDHYSELRKRHNEGGMDAVNAYAAQAKAIVAKAMRKRHPLQLWWWKVLLRLNIFTEAMRQQMETMRITTSKPTNITTKP